MMKTILTTAFIALALSLKAQFVANLEQVPLSSDSHIDGSAGDSLIEEQGFHFPIIWDDAWSFWSGGWAVSNKSDSSRRGMNGLFQSITESGYQSENYLVGQQGSEIVIEASAKTPLLGLYVTNTSFTYHSMKEGDQFAKKFGGLDGNDPDYLLLHILAKENGILKPDTVHVFLADYRNPDNGEDYVLDSWTWVDLSKLGTADTLQFFLESSDTGEFGMNTPGFFAIDNIARDWHVSVQKIENGKLSIYPNPSSSYLNLESNCDWIIFDMQGIERMKGSQRIIDIRGMESGMYLLLDQNGNSQRFIKQ